MSSTLLFTWMKLPMPCASNSAMQAGAPACKDELEAQGIKNFISIRDNVLETLHYYLKELGI